MKTDQFKNVSPDNIWLHKDARAFFYIPHTNFLVVGDSWMDRHQDIIRRPKVQKQFSQIPGFDFSYADHFNTRDFALLGRVGYQRDEESGKEQQVVSFWNRKPELYTHLKDAITELQRTGHVVGDAVVVSPITDPKAATDITGIKSDQMNRLQEPAKLPQEVFPKAFGDTGEIPDTLASGDIPIPATADSSELDQFRGINDPTKLSPEQRALWQNLHLMEPGAKKQAMAQLGLGQGSKKRPWQKEMEKQKLIQPGQKWWAATSEGALSFSSWLVHTGKLPL